MPPHGLKGIVLLKLSAIRTGKSRQAENELDQNHELERDDPQQRAEARMSLQHGGNHGKEKQGEKRVAYSIAVKCQETLPLKPE